MVTVKFKLDDRFVAEVEMTGHAGYAEEGYDIVCAAVSSAVMLTHALICDIIGVNLITEVDETLPRIFLKVPDDCRKKSVSDAMSALMLHLVSLKEEYPDNIDVLEV